MEKKEKMKKMKNGILGLNKKHLNIQKNLGGDNAKSTWLIRMS